MALAQPSTSKASAGRGSVPRRGPPEFPDRVRFEYDGTTPLIYAPDKCAELVSQINGGPRPLPLKDLIFKKEYTDTAQARLRVRILLLFLLSDMHLSYGADGDRNLSLFRVMGA